jgi:putative ABC transport system permease protein
MKGLALLAWRHLVHHKLRSALLALATLLAAFLPITVDRLVTAYGSTLRERAATTPLLAGAKGSRYDLALAALYFEGRIPEPVPNSLATKIQDSGLALAIPLALGRSAQGFPLVGTSVDYFEFRGLSFAAGSPPAFLGEAVLGARVARELSLNPGDAILSDRSNVYDLSLAYPLKMRVVGVLAESGAADDGAVFVDTRTAWTVDGLGHGHAKEAAEDPDLVLAESEGNVALNAAVVEFVEVTPDNLADFHFHADPESLPLSAVIAVPRNDKSSTLLKGRFRVEPDHQLLVPLEAIDEILGFVFQLKRFFDLEVLLVGAAMSLFLALVVLLSLKVRERELETLRKIGCARFAIATMVTYELALTLGAGLLAAIVAGNFAAHAFARWILSL